MTKLNFVLKNGEHKPLIEGISFDGITPNWKTKYSCFINWGGEEAQVVFSGIAIQGESKLSKHLFAKVFVNGKAIGRKKSFSKWATEPYEFVMEAGETAEVVFEFSTKELQMELQGVSDMYDFEFGEVEVVRKDITE